MENINSNLVGLTDSEVQKRIDEGKVNISTNIKTKSIKRIFCDNIFTLFNLINVILLAALIFVGSHKNMLFIGVVIANIIIGIVQEIRSKISVDKLTILSEKKINVLRNGKIAEISKDEIVLDDILVLSRGSQIPADCIVCDGNCRVNESLLKVGGSSPLGPTRVPFCGWILRPKGLDLKIWLQKRLELAS